jgi:succinoglycan biosynthesis protein ExoL
MKATYLLPVVSHPRFHKRIGELKTLGVEPAVLTFERDYFRGKTPNFTFQSLGRISHGAYRRRLFPYLRALPTIRTFTQNADIVYAFGLDLALLGHLSRARLRARPKLVYELGDIRSVLIGESLQSELARRLERWLVARADLVVATSEEFITSYFAKYHGDQSVRYLVIENKLANGVLPAPNQLAIATVERNRFPLQIGYFGVLRCPRSWRILQEVIERGEQRFGLYVRGILVHFPNFKDKLHRIKGVTFGGAYVFPDELPEMYERVDMMWVAYPYSSQEGENWQWARTNRFYEACYFRKPMLAQAGSADAKLIEKYNLGMTLDLGDVEGSANRILGVTTEDIDEWQRNLETLPSSIYMYTDEHERLLRALQ